MRVQHEVQDGLYGRIQFDSLERRLIDSAPFQRLRHIHQLAMCYQVYPGATHKRFEHSLGVMEVASRIFDTIFDPRNVRDNIRERIAEELEPQQIQYWKRVVRLAALLHDIGHLPFSHAAEKELLPSGWNHERITVEMLRHSEIADILREASPPVRPEDVIDAAWDISKRVNVEAVTLSPWKTLLNEILTSNTFGADRIDYLLRDSWHAGVPYGRFDTNSLISGLRVIIDPDDQEIAIGLDIGGIHAAEALLLARYFMYTQVYLHDVRRAYDAHLKAFLQGWLDEGKFSGEWRDMLRVTDNDVLVALHRAALDETDPFHAPAALLMNRKHFRTVYSQVAAHKLRCPTVLDDVLTYAQEHFGSENVLKDHYLAKSEPNEFFVLTTSNSIENARQISGIIDNVPVMEVGFIFVEPSLEEQAKRQIDAHLKTLL